MPPQKSDALGWKFFFGLMAFVQIAALAIAGVVWSIVSDTQESVREVKQRQEEVIIPRLVKLEGGKQGR